MSRLLLLILTFACSALTYAQSQLYDLWVGGIQVSTDNENDILEDGTTSYDSKANKLTFNTIEKTIAKGQPIVKNKIDGLTIHFNGPCRFSVKDIPAFQLRERTILTSSGEVEVVDSGYPIFQVNATLQILASTWATTGTQFFTSGESRKHQLIIESANIRHTNDQQQNKSSIDKVSDLVLTGSMFTSPTLVYHDPNNRDIRYDAGYYLQSFQLTAIDPTALTHILLSTSSQVVPPIPTYDLLGRHHTKGIKIRERKIIR